MSKERLEEIKREYKKDVYDCKLGRFEIDWLIEQAEREQELEEEIKSHAPEGRNYTNEQYVDLLHENKRYREVLEESYAELRQLHSSLEVSGASSNDLGVLEYVGLTLIKQALDKIGGIEND